jgi:hypothetical protein
VSPVELLRDDEQRPQAEVGPGRRLALTPARDIRSERIRWLWQPRLPLRSLSVIAGEKGLGKSILTNARLVAEATRGELAGELQGQPIDVLIVTAEDDWRSVVKPRLMAHDADLDRVHRVTVSDQEGESLLTLPDDVPLLEAQILNLRGQGRTVGMMVVDPISAFMSEATDTHRDASVRRALAPLAAMAERMDLVVVVVAHLTKDDSTRLIHRVSGSGAFVNAARSVLVLASSPDDPDGEQGTERVLVHVRGNWGRSAPTLAARVESRDVDLDDGSRTSVGYMEITGETDIAVEDLQRGRDENGGADVDEAILAALTEGAKPSREVKTRVVNEVSCSKRTVERAAVRIAQDGDLLIESGGFPRTTTWALPSSDTTTSHSGDTVALSVATSTNIKHVATADSGVAAGYTENSSLSSDIGDSLQRDVSAVVDTPICCCLDGGDEPTTDGRCSRCWGRRLESHQS